MADKGFTLNDLNQSIARKESGFTLSDIGIASGEGEKAIKQPKKLSNMDKVAKGAIDPIEGGAQLLYNVLPEGLRNAGDNLNNWLADKTGLIKKLPQGGLNELVKANEQEYQAARTAQGESGLDGLRIAGNVISPANLAVSAQAMKAAPLISKAASIVSRTPTVMAGNVAAGALGGIGQGAIMPVVEGDNYFDEKGKQVALNGAVGAALPVLGKLMPKNTAAASELKAAGVDVPLGQSMGGIARTIEDKATSIPFLGDAINSARKNSIEQFNLATINKALAPAGEKLDAGVKAGREAIDNALTKLNGAYNTLLPKLKVQADNQFVNDMSQLKQMAQNLPDAELNQFNRIIANEVEGRFTPAGLMSGQTMKEVESKLGQLARGYGKTPGYNNQALSDALFQAQANLRSAVERSNPQFSQELQNINQAYAAMLRPERAAGYVGAVDGVFTPAQLVSAVKAADPSLRHRAFARGNALMQDWAENAKGTLSSTVPDSGTAGRLALGGSALGGLAYINPYAAATGALATAAYLPGGRQVASGLLNLSEGTAKAITNRAPYATPLVAPLAYGLLGPAVTPNQ